MSLSFRYVAGYTPPPGQTKTGPTVTLALLDVDTDAVVKKVAYVSNLTRYSYDRFTGYSPRIPLSGSGLDLPDDKPVVVALLVDNEARNLQIPVDDKAAGFDVRVRWKNNPSQGLVGSGVFGAGQVWCKKQADDSQACLVINQGSQPITHDLDLTKIGLNGANSYAVRDIWLQKDAGTASKSHKVVVPPYDSAFLLFK